MSLVNVPTLQINDAITKAYVDAVTGDINELIRSTDGILYPGMYKLWDSVEAGVTLPAASITTPTLPSTFKHYLLMWLLGTNSTAQADLGLRVNGNTTTTYATGCARWGLSTLSTLLDNLSYCAIGYMAAPNGTTYGIATLTPQFGFIRGVALAGGTGFTLQVAELEVPSGSVSTLTVLPLSGQIGDGRFTVYGAA